MQVGIIANPYKPGAVGTIERLTAALQAHGMSVVLEDRTAAFSKKGTGLPGPQLAAEVGLIVVLGGDGTVLHAVETLGATEKPIAGINIGTLGFLTCCTDDEIETFAGALRDGKYGVSRRTLLSATVQCDDTGPREFIALNEAVLARGQTGRLVSLQASINGDLLNRYRADGLIVSTPTGSTAYSLSAGGPLISPEAGVFVITPICPHTLSQQSLVVDDEAVIELSPESDEGGPMLFTVDGRNCVEVRSCQSIVVKKAAQSLNIIGLEGRSFYRALRKKLHWRGG